MAAIAFRERLLDRRLRFTLQRMGLRFFVILLMAVVSHLLTVEAAGPPVQFGKDYTSVTLVDGTVLTRVRVSRFDGAVFHIEHAGGIARVPPANMPQEWRSLANSRAVVDPEPASVPTTRQPASKPMNAGASSKRAPQQSRYVSLDQLSNSPAQFVGTGIPLRGEIAPMTQVQEASLGYVTFRFLTKGGNVTIFMPESAVATRLSRHIVSKGGKAVVGLYCAFEPARGKGTAANELRVVAVDWLPEEETGNGNLVVAALDRATAYAKARIERDKANSAQQTPATTRELPKAGASGPATAEISLGIGESINLAELGLNPVPFTLMDIGNGSILVRIGRTGEVQKIPLKIGMAGTRTQVYTDEQGSLSYIDSAARPNGKGLFELKREKLPQ